MYKVTEIEWDTEEDEIDLPKEVYINHDIEEDEIVDFLSDEYGWCIKSCSIEKQ